MRSNNSNPARRHHQRQSGFTMVELLTVIAIIAVLATLLMAAVGGAKKKSRTARCTSNLHQIALAINMYLDDADQRPTAFDPLLTGRYLAGGDVLLCPEDKTGNWGGLVNGSYGPLSFVAVPNGVNSSLTPRSTPVPFSYLHPLPWEESAWNQLLRFGSAAGLAVCQLHGLGRPNPASPSIHDLEGLVLRGRKDGAVVRRKVFWVDNTLRSQPAGQFDGNTTTMSGPSSNVSMMGSDYPWDLFADEPATTP